MLCDEYEDGLSYKKISEKYRISESSVRKMILPFVNVRNNKSETSRTYSLNENYFDYIDSEVKAYYIGLLYADGYNREDRNTIVLSLQEEDGYIIEKLFNELEYQRPLNKLHRKEKYKKIVTGEITSKHMSDVIAKYGCVQNKTFKLVFPNWLDKNLYQHFIRGYFDGDGSIVIPKTGFRSCSVKIAGTHNLLIGLQKTLNDECDIGISKLTKLGNIYMLQIGGANKILKVLNYIYKDSTIYLHRKYEQYEKVVEYNETKGKIIKLKRTRSDNKSGVTGVYWDKRISKWAARIQIHGKDMFLGNFIELDDAIRKRKEIEEKYCVQFAI